MPHDDNIKMYPVCHVILFAYIHPHACVRARELSDVSGSVEQHRRCFLKHYPYTPLSFLSLCERENLTLLCLFSLYTATLSLYSSVFSLYTATYICMRKVVAFKHKEDVLSINIGSVDFPQRPMAFDVQLLPPLPSPSSLPYAHSPLSNASDDSPQRHVAVVAVDDGAVSQESGEQGLEGREG